MHVDCEKNGKLFEFVVNLLNCPDSVISPWSSCFSKVNGFNLVQVCTVCVSTSTHTHIYTVCVCLLTHVQLSVICVFCL